MEPPSRYTVHIPQWPCSPVVLPRQLLVVCSKPAGEHIIVLTATGVFRLDVAGRSGAIEQLSTTGGQFMSAAPSGDVIFVSRSVSTVAVMHMGPVATYVYDCRFPVTGLAALSDTATVVATATCCWVLYSKGSPAGSKAHMQSVAGTLGTAGFCWHVPGLRALFVQISAVAAVPYSKDTWTIVGHDRVLRRLFAFELTYLAAADTWTAGCVRLLAGSGSRSSPFGRLLRLEPSASPHIVVASAWAANCCKRYLFAVNTLVGAYTLVCQSDEPAVTALGCNGTVYHASVPNLKATRHTRAPSAAVSRLRGFWCRKRHRALPPHVRRAVVVVIAAMTRAGMPAELMQYVLEMVAVDTFGRALC